MGPQKSMPVLANGLEGFTLSMGKLPIICSEKRGFDLKQITHWRINFLTVPRALRGQYDWRTAAKVASAQVWKFLLCSCCIINSVSFEWCGSTNGYFVLYCNSVCLSFSPTCKRPLLSMNGLRLFKSLLLGIFLPFGKAIISSLNNDRCPY